MVRSNLNGDAKILLAKLEVRFDGLDDRIDRSDVKNTDGHNRIFKHLEDIHTRLNGHSKKLAKHAVYITISSGAVMVMVGLVVTKIVGG